MSSEHRQAAARAGLKYVTDGVRGMPEPGRPRVRVSDGTPRWDPKASRLLVP